MREVRFLSPDSAVLRAIAGMVPPGETDLNDNTCLQSLVAVRGGSRWRIALWQNTPAAFDGRPETRLAVDEELRELIRSTDAPGPR